MPPHARFLAVVRRIPRGRVASYGQVAALAGFPGHARQVGYALHAADDGSRVPWHRVVNARGEVVVRDAGAQPTLAAARQRALLEAEGVGFDARGRVVMRRHQWAPRGVRPVVALVLASAITACAPEAVPPPAPPAPPPVLVEVPWQGDGASAPADRGVGVVARREPVPARLAPGGADTLVIRARPDAGSTVIGGFVVRREGESGWSHTVLLEEGDVPNLLEFGYEEVGLPLVATTVDSTWVRVVFAHARDGAPRAGWIPRDSSLVQVIHWRDHLPQQVLFSLPGMAALHEAPGGPLVRGPVMPPEGDHILHVEDRDGDWLRVRLVSPSDYCADPVDPLVLEGWIRYLDVAGRPRVWYYTRGC